MARSDEREIHCFMVDGSVGSGKSSMLRELEASVKTKDYKIIVLDEPYHLFNRFGCWKPLELCAQNVKENGLACQLHIMKAQNEEMHRLCAELRETNLDSARPLLIVCDRSIYSPQIFIAALENLGHISEFSADYLRYELATRALKTVSECKLRFVGLAYLHTPVSECLSRIRRRGRPFEQGVDERYLRALEESHEAYVAAWEQNLGPDRVFRLCDNKAEMLEKAIDNALRHFDKKDA